MFVVSVVDYALPCMQAEKMLKEVHDAALHGDLEKAMEYATQAIAECKLLFNSLKIMKEKENARRPVA